MRDNFLVFGSNSLSFILTKGFSLISFFVGCTLFFALSGTVSAADGDLDLTFNPGKGADGAVDAVALQSDDKLIIGGNFSIVDDTARVRVARLNTDGSLDTSFDPGTGPNSEPTILAVQSDGKILISGAFTTVDGTARNAIARLNTDGSLDTSFDPGTGPMIGALAGAIDAIRVQTDGKILISGSFTSYNGTSRTRIARINSDGSIDTGFVPPSINNRIWSMALQSDGDVVIGGDFTLIGATSRTRLARLNSDGTHDTGFSSGTGANSSVFDIELQSDGKLIVTGSFSTINGTSRNKIARLNTTGSHDTTFSPGTGPSSSISDMRIQSDDKVLIGGSFTTFNGSTANYIARLSSAGAFDSSFAVGTGPNNQVRAIALRSTGEVAVGGTFEAVGTVPRHNVAQFESDGSLDTAFDTGTDVYFYDEASAVALQSDGKIVLGGFFSSLYVGALSNNVARLDANGNLDATFSTGDGPTWFGFEGYVRDLALQSDDKAIIVGDFDDYSGTARNNLARLNTDGSLDTSFDPGTGTDSTIRSVVVQSDGKIVIAGSFTDYNGTGRNGIARLNTDGSLDTSFDPGTGTTSGIYALALQSDGKILIGGYFTSFNAVTRRYVARLNTDGSVDTGFTTGTAANNGVESLAVQSDGKVLIGGYFTNYDGTTISSLMRINSDGSRDTGFAPTTGPNSAVLSIVLQSDDKIVIGGGFTSVDEVLVNRVARLESDGSRDTSFSQWDTGPDGAVNALVLQNDTHVLIAGAFYAVGDAMRVGIARIESSSTPTTALVELSSATATSTTEATADNFPVLLVDGTVSSSQTIDIEITGGTATGSGTDYTFTSPLTVTVPAGSYDGTSGTAITITAPTLIDDTSDESDETIIFGLTGPSAGLSIGDANGNSTTVSAHTYTLTDDDGAAADPVPDDGDDEISDRSHRPTNLKAVERENGVKLTWKDNSDAEKSYRIERKQDGGTYEKIASVVKNTERYTDKDALLPGMKYIYRVQAVRKVKRSPYSDRGVVTLASLEPIPVPVEDDPDTTVPVTEPEPTPETEEEPPREAEEEKENEESISEPEKQASVTHRVIAMLDHPAVRYLLLLSLTSQVALLFLRLRLKEVVSYFSAMLHAGTVPIRRRKKGFGLIFDVETGKPLMGARLTVTDSKGSAQSQMVNGFGQYAVLIPRGSYALSVEKEGYRTVSPQEHPIVLSGREIYDGGAFTFEEPGIIKIDIAMERIDRTQALGVISFHRTHEKLWSELSKVFFYVSFAVMIAALLLDPTLVGALLLLCFLLIAFLDSFGLMQAEWGEIRLRASKASVPFAAVKLFMDDKTMTHRTIADEYGRYYIMAEKGKYLLTAEGEDRVRHEARSAEKSIRIKEELGFIQEKIAI